jgi:hypothetical protein
MIGSLADRIAAAMSESDRVWSAQEIARDFLKLTRSGPATDALVRGLLAPDRRFQEIAAGWSVRIAPGVPLFQTPLWLAQVETGADPNIWRLHLRLRDRSQIRPAAYTLAPDRPSEWSQARRSVSGARLAAFQPALVQRSIGWMERTHAIGEWDSIDLLSWTKIALREEGVPADQLGQLARMPELARRWNLGPIRDGSEGALDILASVVDELEQRYPAWTEHDLSRARAEVLEPRPVDFSRFAFTRSDIDALPTGSGVYRFWDSAGRLLYAGKAASLHARVGSYFRSLPHERTKREELLDALDRFEVQTCPSELEALILESRAIRDENPRWNVQVAVHRPERFPPDWRWPLVFVPPSNDSNRATVLLVQGRDRGILLRLPRDPGAWPGALDGRWLEPLCGSPETNGLQETNPAPEPNGLQETNPAPETNGLQGTGSAGPGNGAPVSDLELPFSHLWLHREEVWLSLRYYARQRDLVDSCDGWASSDELWQRLRALVESVRSRAETVRAARP